MAVFLIFSDVRLCEISRAIFYPARQDFAWPGSVLPNYQSEVAINQLINGVCFLLMLFR